MQPAPIDVAPFPPATYRGMRIAGTGSTSTCAPAGARDLPQRSDTLVDRVGACRDVWTVGKRCRGVFIVAYVSHSRRNRYRSRKQSLCRYGLCERNRCSPHASGGA